MVESVELWCATAGRLLGSSARRYAVATHGEVHYMQFIL